LFLISHLHYANEKLRSDWIEYQWTCCASKGRKLALLIYTASCCANNHFLKSNWSDRSNKLRTIFLAIENIRTRGNFVAFHKIACNEQEMLPGVLRGFRNAIVLTKSNPWSRVLPTF
jgi:hypothetical protein